jgi:hypothetical protein
MSHKKSRYALILVSKARPTIYTVTNDGRAMGTLRPGTRVRKRQMLWHLELTDEAALPEPFMWAEHEFPSFTAAAASLGIIR